MMGKYTETSDPSFWELMDSMPTIGETTRDKRGLLHVGDSCAVA